MSSRNYTVTIKLKDDGKLAGLQALTGGGAANPNGGGAKPSPALGGDGGFFKSLQDIGLTQVLKLTGIGLSLAGITQVLRKSSGLLEANFRLAEYSMLLFFKPFGDFLGMMFRPMVAGMLQWALAFYKIAGPFFRDFAAKTPLVPIPGLVGQDILDKNPEARRQADSLSQIFPTLQVYAASIQGSLKDFAKSLNDSLIVLPPLFTQIFLDFGKNLWNGLLEVPKFIYDLFVNVGTGIWDYLKGIPSLINQTFSDFATNVYNGILSVPGMIMDVFSGLATNLVSTLSGIPGAIYNAIMSWITSLGGAFGGGGGGNTSPTGTKVRTQMTTMADARSI